MSNNNILVIGIAGGTGSGKSTLTKQLVNHFGDQITVLKHDDYYKAHDEMTYEERTHLNYDHPNAFDTDLMLQHLRQLKNGEPINCPIYDYTVHNRSRNFQVIYPTNVIIVEGILIFENKELCKEMDIKIFVDTDAETETVEDSGNCNINEHTLDALIEPQKTGIYCLRFMYKIADETWVDNYKIKVKG